MAAKKPAHLSNYDLLEAELIKVIKQFYPKIGSYDYSECAQDTASTITSLLGPIPSKK